MNHTYLKKHKGAGQALAVLLFGTAQFLLNPSHAQAEQLNTSYQQQVQFITVTGQVTDENIGSGIQGVTIVDDKDKILGTTNKDGNFSVKISKGTVVVFKMIGYDTVKQSFQENRGQLLIKMTASNSNLEEVVVTALGIKREERALGYAVTKLDSSAFTNAIATNWTDALSGKVAGLNLVRNSGPAGSNKIILRGENNLTGDNEALIVIDGVVASSSAGRSAPTGGGVYGTSGDIMPTDYGSALNDLNPEDIENVTVLKGPGASALYGQRGANGAIIITTKSGAKSGNKMNITFSSNTSWETINRSLKRQDKFGQGQHGAAYFSYGTTEDGGSTNGTSASWGAPFGNGALYYQYDPSTKTRGLTRTPWRSYQDPEAFFQTGVETKNSLSISGKINKTSYRFSGSYGNNDWIVPNTGLKRSSLNLSVNTKLAEKLDMAVKVLYNNRNSDNLPATGYGNQSLMYWFMLAQKNVDIDWYKDYWAPGKENEQFVNITTTNPESPYALSEQYINGQRRNGVLGNIQLSYKFTKELDLMVRSSIDYNRDKRETSRPYDAAGNKFAQGSFRVQDIDSYELNNDFLLRYDKKFSKKFRASATVGGSQVKNVYNKAELRADGLKVPGIFRLDNNANPLISVPDTAKYNINSLYAAVSLSFKNYLYVDLTGRQDWSSTLALPTRSDNVGFFYPSASTSFILSEVVDMPRFVNYAKLRASISQVGSGGTTPYRTAYNYILANNGIYPDSAMTNPTTLPNANLKPLKTTTLEVGAEFKLLNRRVDIDIAAYAGNTKNQILSRLVDRSSGYNMAVYNVGRVDNKGIEVAVNGTVIKRKSFSWTLTGTFSANRNTIKELGDSSVVLRSGALGGGQIVANLGGSMGDMYGRGFVRSPDGQIVFDEVTGSAKVNATDLVYLGNTLPKFKFSFGTGITYKQFAANVLFDAQIGAVGHSLTFSRMAALGKLDVTLPGRYNGVIGDGVVQNADGTYRKNDVVATDVENYYMSIYGSDQAEGSVFRTDFLKFREANVNYAFKSNIVNRLGLSKVTVGVYGRNLFTWSPWPAFDPEFGTMAGSDIVQGFETGQLPSTRTLGFRVVVGFK